jgi:hypothetical protein
LITYNIVQKINILGEFMKKCWFSALTSLMLLAGTALTAQAQQFINVLTGGTSVTDLRQGDS